MYIGLLKLIRDPNGSFDRNLLKYIMNHPVPIREHHGGFVAEGPGFYIWDEDPTEVMRVARG
jgi:hypothetical protein